MSLITAFTADLYRLADWLAECRVETVAIESTGVYWISLLGVSKERGFQVMPVDPRRIKNVSGRKTDVLDCQWLQQLHTYGLLSGTFRPNAEIRHLRPNKGKENILEKPEAPFGTGRSNSNRILGNFKWHTCRDRRQ